MSQWMVEKASNLLRARSSRRDFLTAAAVAGSALAVAPVRYILEPGTAYAAICGCLGQDCECGTLCCADGYAEFCCTINLGMNTCPAGTFAGGWWKADGSIYCDGPPLLHRLRRVLQQVQQQLRERLLLPRLRHALLWLRQW